MQKHMRGVGAQTNPQNLAHPTLAFLHNYWNAKRDTRLMPSRADIRPADLKEHLSWVIMADVLPGCEEFRYRLIGTLVTEYFLTEATGKTVTEAFTQSGLDDAVLHGVRAVMRVCSRDRVVIRAYGEAHAFGEGYEEFDSIFLPLSDDGQSVNVILHAMVFNRPEVLMARQIAKANGGRLPRRLKSLSGAA